MTTTSVVATVRQRFAALAEAVTQGDESSLRDLRHLVGATAADAHPEDVAWLRLGLSQLASRQLREGVAAELGGLDAVLEGTQLRLDASRARAARDDHRQTVKQRVLDALTAHGSMRPKELVDVCGSDAYQVSRALRELKESGEIAESPAPHGVFDRRGIWYRLGAASGEGSEQTHPARAGNLGRFLSGSFARGTQIRPLADLDVFAQSISSARIEVKGALTRLSGAWLSLVLEDGLPSGATPSNLDAVDDSPGVSNDFASRHDLTRILGLPSTSPIWLTREGNRCWILTRSSATSAPLVDVVADLSAVGDSLVDSLQREAVPDADTLREIWARRTEATPESQLELATRLPGQVLREVAGDEDLRAYWEFEDPLRSSELVAAARMASALDTDSIRSLVEHVRAVSRRATDELDSLAFEAEGVLATQAHLRPFEQGYALAAWLRQVIGASTDAWVDPETVLGLWNVEVVASTSTPDIDGFACWGPNHGPMVAVNENGRHSASDAGRRTTLAHEIAHLLVDRRGALPLAEVLGGRTAPICEARARAFAVELLLPREEAGRRLAGTADPAAEVTEIAERYRVSREVIAWQARNSSHWLPPTVFEYLRSLVPANRAF